MLTDHLLEAQRDIEQRSSAEGYSRYLKSQENVASNEGPHATEAAMKVIKGSIPMVSLEVSKWLKSANPGFGKGRVHAAFSTLSKFDPDLLAYVALNSVFTGVTKEHTAPAVQVHMGTILETEALALKAEAELDAKVAKRIKSVVQRQGSARNKEKALKKLTADNEVEQEGWSQEFKLKVGEPLINAVLLALPDLFELHEENRGRNQTRVIVRLTDEGVQMLAGLRESAAWMQPVHRPMVVPPRPWEAFDTGCYYDAKNSRNVKLVRTFSSDHRKLIKSAISDGSMRYVLEAINSIQETPWAINMPVLEALLWAWENNVSVSKLTPRTLLDRPERLAPEAWEAMSTQRRKGHRLTIARILEKNRGIVADSMVTARDLETAKELSQYERFYLPHNLDFRGRVYPVCHFSHQRSDHIKALFQFADGCPLGDDGAAWLSVHLANCGDFGKVSKRSFEERLRWVEDNEPLILRIAGDPTGTVAEWRAADSPFMFLAACIDYAGWVHGGRSDLYVSHLPVALDGSNSGLQHYSAALRAEDEAALVSLVPSETPADLYQTVADEVVAVAQAEAAAGDLTAALCLEVGIDRSLVKRNVMTFAYSSATYGFRQQLMSDTMGPMNDAVLTGALSANPYDVARKDEDGEATEQMDGGFAAVGYLASRIYKSVTRTVTKATEGMAFFQKVAGVLASEALPLVWVSPVGLPVVHKYNVYDVKTVQLALFDRKVAVVDAGQHDKVDEEGRGVLRRVRANIRTNPTAKIDRAKAESAVAPNVIHSMDGAHLMLTVLAAKGVGITDVALIHDSFGTHAGRTHEFFQIIREAFVEMYEPPRVCRRRWVVGHAAISMLSAAA